MRRWFLLGGLLLMLSVPAMARTLDSDLYRLQLDVLAEGLEHPWALAFLPEGEVLITERPGRLRVFRDGRLQPEPVTGLPPIHPNGQGGLLDLVLHPDFERNRLIYFSYVDRDRQGFTTRVARARYRNGQLSELQPVFTAEPRSNGGRHFGGRMVFDAGGHLYISVGDRGEMERAQDLNDHAGKILRLQDDGSIPADNPWVGDAGKRPEIYAYGTRNAQGMALLR